MSNIPSLRTIFFGSGELACPILHALKRSTLCELVAVVTQPDKPKGRDLKLQPTPAKVEAMKLQLTVCQPPKARADEFVHQLATLTPDLIAVAAYGQILPQVVLDLPRFGCLNVHASLLPAYRGAAPIQWALLDDQPVTGVTIMKMDAGLDTGDILSQSRTPISPADDARTLHDRLAHLGADLLLKTIPGYLDGSIRPRRQPVEGVTYARKIAKADGRLNWAETARVLWNRVRALTPWPGAFTSLPAETRQPLLKVWQAQVEEQLRGERGEVLQADEDGIVVACGAQALRLLEIQREGGKRLSARQFLAGHPLRPGQRFR